jgi:hypothetical protein
MSRVTLRTRTRSGDVWRSCSRGSDRLDDREREGSDRLDDREREGSDRLDDREREDRD